MIETEWAWHARELVSELTVQELDSYDGIVAVRSFSQSRNCILTAGCTVLVAEFKGGHSKSQIYCVIMQPIAVLTRCALLWRCYSVKQGFSSTVMAEPRLSSGIAKTGMLSR